MATVPETELEQKTSEYIQWVKDYSAHKKGEFIIRGKHDGFKISCFDGDITLEFSL